MENTVSSQNGNLPSESLLVSMHYASQSSWFWHLGEEGHQIHIALDQVLVHQFVPPVNEWIIEDSYGTAPEAEKKSTLVEKINKYIQALQNK